MTARYEAPKGWRYFDVLAEPGEYFSVCGECGDNVTELITLDGRLTARLWHPRACGLWLHVDPDGSAQ